VIGEADLLALDLFFNVYAFHIHLVPGWKPVRFSMVHAKDLAQSLILAAERGNRVLPNAFQVEKGQVVAMNGQGIYFPADPSMPTFAEFGKLIAEGFGRKRVLCLHTPHAATWILAAISELFGKVVRKPMALNLDKAREAVAGNWICSPRSAQLELGFQPATPLAARIQQTAQWYHQQGWI
jgi:nucleoside-diphosphate-sugar epimerase